MSKAVLELLRRLRMKGWGGSNYESEEKATTTASVH